MAAAPGLVLSESMAARTDLCSSNASEISGHLMSLHNRSYPAYVVTPERKAATLAGYRKRTSARAFRPANATPSNAVVGLEKPRISEQLRETWMFDLAELESVIPLVRAWVPPTPQYVGLVVEIKR